MKKQLTILAAALLAMSAFSAQASYVNSTENMGKGSLHSNVNGQSTWGEHDEKYNDKGSRIEGDSDAKRKDKGNQGWESLVKRNDKYGRSKGDDHDETADADDDICLTPPGVPSGPRPSEVTAVPLPAAIWLLGTGLIGLVGVARRKV